jgi:hypothetical protein
MRNQEVTSRTSVLFSKPDKNEIDCEVKVNFREIS